MRKVDLEIAESWYWWLCIAVMVSSVSYIAVKLLIHRYQKTGHIDVPNQRSMHQIPTPTGAGIVIACFIFSAALFLGFYLNQFELVWAAIILGVLALIGWRDDKNQLSVKLRLIGFFFLSVMLILGVGLVDQIKFGQMFIWDMPYFIALIFTILFFIWVLNLYNFMDGMDGLAAMQTIIGASGFFILFVYAGLFNQQHSDAHLLILGFAGLSAVLCFSTVGFLVLNWSPAKIFLGDVGSLPLGGFFAICTVIAVTKLDVSIISCFLMIGVFIFDATYTLIARIFRGEKITQAHRSHCYQRLDSLGVGHRTIVSTYSIIMIMFVLIAILLEWQRISGLVAGVFVLIGVIFIRIWVWQLDKKQDVK